MHSDTSRRKKVQCSVCDAWLSNRYTLKTHLLTHSSEPQKCPQCDKVSPNHHALMCHIKEVHTEAKHKCSCCDKLFKTPTALKVRFLHKIQQETFLDLKFIFNSTLRIMWPRIHGKNLTNARIARKLLFGDQICTVIKRKFIQSNGSLIKRKKSKQKECNHSLI